MCFGSVHPWAYTAMEEIAFALIIAWAAKAWLNDGRILRAGGLGAIAAVAIPLMLVFAIMAGETAPMPSALLAKLSPAASTIYFRALPGWPERPAYRDVNFDAPAVPPSDPVILPT